MRAIALAVAASAALIVSYLALGGASYAPAKAADPCAPRDWRQPTGVQAVTEQIVLSALDGAACELRVTREQIVLAFASRESLSRFAREHGIGSHELERLARTGLLRGVNDAERARVVDHETAALLRDVVRRIRIAQLLDLLNLLPAG